MPDQNSPAAPPPVMPEDGAVNPVGTNVTVNATVPPAGGTTTTTTTVTPGGPKRGQLIATIFGMLLLIGGVGAGIALVGNQQLFQQHAGGIACGAGSCNDGFQYGQDCSAPQSSCSQRASDACLNHGGPAGGGGPISCGTTGGGGGSCTINACSVGVGSYWIGSQANGYKCYKCQSASCGVEQGPGACCSVAGPNHPYYIANNCGGTGGGGTDPNQNQDTVTTYPGSGSACVVGGVQGMLCSCAIGDACSGGVIMGQDDNGKGTCFYDSPAITCIHHSIGGGGGSDPNQNQGDVNTHGMSCSGANCTLTQAQACSPTMQGVSYYCPGGLSGGACLENRQSIGSFTPGQSIDLTSFSRGNTCGAIQVDFGAPGTTEEGCGAATYVLGAPCVTATTAPTGTNTPTGTTTPGGPTAQCTGVRAYDTSFNLLTSAQLAALQPGDHVRFAVTGTASSGTFDKARFTINGTLRPEVTSKVPSTNEFYDDYVVPTGVSAFTVTSQIHHAGLNQWF